MIARPWSLIRPADPDASVPVRMVFPDIRHRSGYLFLAVAVGHIILISAQVNSRSGVPLLQAVVFGAFAEVQRGTAGVVRRRAPARGTATSACRTSTPRTRRCRQRGARPAR